MSLFIVRNTQTYGVALAGLIAMISGCSDTGTGEDSTTELVATNETQAIVSTPEPIDTQVLINTPLQVNTPTPSAALEQIVTPVSSDAPQPSNTPELGDTPTLSNTPVESETPAPSNTPVESETPAPSNTPVESEVPAPSNTPVESETPAPTNTPVESEAPAPTNTPVESESPAPSNTPEESEAPAPSSTPEESESTAPSNTPEESEAPAPSSTPEESESTAPSNTPEESEIPTTEIEEEPPSTTEDEQSPRQGIAPDTGALLGANVAKGIHDTRYEGVVAFEELLGRNIAIINRFHEFSAGVESNFFWDRRHIEDGRTVMISWRATDNAGSVNGTPDPNRASKIVAGEFDREIEAMARALSDLEAPVLLRFNWEMDQDSGDPQHIGTPSEFISAWRHAHDIFRNLGVSNVEWVWAPRARSFSRDIGQSYYPGFEYVDWIGGSAVPVNSFTDPQTIYSAWNEWASSLGKPQLLWVGLRENPDDSRWKADFIDELRQLTSSTWQGIKAIVYYNSDSPLGYDYFIDTSARSLRAFRALACDPHYTTTTQDC